MLIHSMFVKLLILFAAMSFFFFGFNCVFSNKMKLEFKRYGLVNYRNMTGILQILGSFGLLLGLKFPVFITISSAGLSILMLMGVITRVVIKDTITQLLPAIFYLCICLYFFLISLS